MIKSIKTAIGKMIVPVSRSRRLAEMGCGGGGGFAGLPEEYASPYRPDGILMGQSLRDPTWRVGLDSGNLVTCAAPGAGKGLTGTIPNLLLSRQNAIVIDVKGTHTMVTAATRGHGGGRVRDGMGQDVYVLDPFGVTAGGPACRKLCGSIRWPRSTRIRRSQRTISKAWRWD